MTIKHSFAAWMAGFVFTGLVGCGGGSAPTANAPSEQNAAVATTHAVAAPSADQMAPASSDVPLEQPPLPVVAAAPPLAPLNERLPGKWHGVMVVDEEGIKTLPAGANIDDLRNKTMGLTFGADGQLLFSGEIAGKPYQTQGQWQFVKEVGPDVTLKSIEGNGAAEDMVLLFDGNDTFYMPVKTEVANLGAMKFERMR